MCEPGLRFDLYGRCVCVSVRACQCVCVRACVFVVGYTTSAHQMSLQHMCSPDVPLGGEEERPTETQLLRQLSDCILNRYGRQSLLNRHVPWRWIITF